MGQARRFGNRPGMSAIALIADISVSDLISGKVDEITKFFGRLGCKTTEIITMVICIT
jgi:hypothetical protein